MAIPTASGRPRPGTVEPAHHQSAQGLLLSGLAGAAPDGASNWTFEAETRTIFHDQRAWMLIVWEPGCGTWRKDAMKHLRSLALRDAVMRARTNSRPLARGTAVLNKELISPLTVAVCISVRRCLNAPMKSPWERHAQGSGKID